MKDNRLRIAGILNAVMNHSAISLNRVRETFKRIMEIDNALGKYQLTEAEKKQAQDLAQTTRLSYLEAIQRVVRQRNRAQKIITIGLN